MSDRGGEGQARNSERELEVLCASGAVLRASGAQRGGLYSSEVGTDKHIQVLTIV